MTRSPVMSAAIGPAVPKGLALTFSPLDVGPVTVPNRVVRTAHFTGMAEAGMVSDDMIAYHVARGEGGVGLSIIEATAVHPSSVLGLMGFDEAVTGRYRALVEAVKPTGMRLFQQLWHSGHIYNGPGNTAPRGASRIPGPASGVPAIPIRTDEIPEFIDGFVRSATFSIEAGLDGVELAASHGYLLHQFLSPWTNTRTDRYGGSAQNRMRFLVETLRAVRDQIGGRGALGIRVGAGGVAGDVDEDDLSELVCRLAAEGLIDYVNVSMGDYYNPDGVTGAMHNPAGYQLPSSSKVTAATDRIPRLVTGRFRTLQEVEQVLREGVADLVSMVRAHIADPDIVAKTRAGHPEQVRPCIGCNQGCLARISGPDQRMGCVVNPVIGSESTLAERLIGTTGRPRRVLVVGGGPAGLEAARTARLRGHEVDLHEAAQHLGGALLMARLAPRMQGLDDILQWQRDEVARLGVGVHTMSYLSADEIIALGPDVVIIATGAETNMDGRLIEAPGQPVQGMGSAHVMSSSDLLGRGARGLGPGRSALVWDEMGHYEGVAVTEFLLERGVDVTVATRFAAFAPLFGPTSGRIDPALERFAHDPGRIRIIPRAQLLSVEPGAALVRQRGQADERVPADIVVMVTYKLPVDTLAYDLRGRVPQVLVVGDAHSGRDLQIAVREGHRAGRSIS